MEPLELLSEAVIDTLKKFSIGKRTLTSATLQEAFSTREDVRSLLYPVVNASTNGEGQGLSGPGKEPPRVSPAESETLNEPDTGSVSEIRNAFLKILDRLGPVMNEDYTNRFRELQKKIKECESLIPLGLIGEQVGEMAGELINRTIESLGLSNDYLIELSKDLYKMEEQLLSYQTYNKETHQIGSEFHNDLLSHTYDMHRAFDSGKSLKDIRDLITLKLNTISKAIETKCKSDDARLLEADTKIAELQNNLRTYKEEILQVRDRAEHLEKEVLLDELTQMNNRRAYDLQIRESLRRYHRNGEQFSLVLMDIDQFKKVNDSYGHWAGDKCLKEIAKLIKSSLRKTDFFARYGGEELIAILYGASVGNARDVAEKLRRHIEKARFYYQNDIIRVTISLGVTQVMPSDTEPEAPFSRVDEAMYRAKQDGRNRVRVITDLSLRKRPAETFELAASQMEQTERSTHGCEDNQPIS